MRRILRTVMLVCARPKAPGLAVLLASGLLTAATHGAGTQAFMSVRAEVKARTDIQSSAPSALMITTADLARGTVTPAQPLQIRAFSNTSRGLEIDLQAPVGMFTQLRVQAPGIDAVLPGAGGSFAWRWDAKPGFNTPVSLDLRITFTLSQDTPAGSHDWPLQLAGRALVQ